MKIGDKIVCSNNQTYTLGEGDDFYTFSLIDSMGNVATLANDYYLEDCLQSDKEDYATLCIGKDIDNDLIYVEVLELIENHN